MAGLARGRGNVTMTIARRECETIIVVSAAEVARGICRRALGRPHLVLQREITAALGAWDVRARWRCFERLKDWAPKTPQSWTQNGGGRGQV